MLHLPPSVLPPPSYFSPPATRHTVRPARRPLTPSHGPTEAPCALSSQALNDNCRSDAVLPPTVLDIPDWGDDN